MPSRESDVPDGSQAEVVPFSLMDSVTAVHLSAMEQILLIS
jgi:hypothetical protein